MRICGRSRNNDDGMALILVLGFAATIGGLAAALLASMETGAKTGRGVEHAIQRRVAIESAIDLTAARLRDPAGQPFRRGAFEFMDVAVDVEIKSKSTSFDINAASPEELEAWLSEELEDEPELAQTLAHQIVDWRDDNDLRHLEGAEADDYRRAGLDYAPANAPFRHVFELRELLGMTDELFKKLHPRATVASGKAPFSSENAQDDAENATNEDGISATEDDDDVVDVDNDEVDDVASEGEPQVQGTEDGGDLYRLRIEARSASGGEQMSEAVIWTEPEVGMSSYELLDFQPHVLKAEDS